MALNQRHLNPQLGRIVRTLGFDRDWVPAHGSHLIDREGNRYLDLLAGYGVFSLGRNHPYVRRQLRAVLAADTPTLPQLGVSRCPGVLAEELIARAPASLDAVVLTSSGTESVEGALKLAAPPPAARGSSTATTPSTASRRASLSVNGNARVPRAVRPAAARLRPGAVRRPRRAGSASCAAGDVAAFIVEPIQGKGVFSRPTATCRPRQELCHAPARC